MSAERDAFERALARRKRLDRRRGRPQFVAGLALAAAAGGAVAIAVDEKILEGDDAEAARSTAGDVVVLAGDLGDTWQLDALADLDDGPDDPGFLGGCARQAVAGAPSGPGAFAALSDTTGDTLTSEVRRLGSAGSASEGFQAAVSADATECVRRAVQDEGIEVLGAGVTVVATVEPSTTPPGVDEAVAYHVQVDADGEAVRRVEVQVLRVGRAIAAMQLTDQGEPLPAEVAARAIETLTSRLIEHYGTP